jgi:enolase
MKITGLSASVIFDSKARPTIRVDLESGNIKTFASAPSGTSVGKFEAQAFPKEGVETAVEIVNSEIRTKLVGLQLRELEEVDDKIRTIDGTSNFGRIGGNTAIAISIAAAKAYSDAEGKMLCEYLSRNNVMKLPFPLSNIIGGGRHTVGDSIDFQEFLVIPSGAKTFGQAAGFNVEVHKEASRIITDRSPKYVLGRNDEGAWAAPLKIEEALTVLSSAIEKAEKNTGIKGRIGIDAASSELWDGKRYDYKKEGRHLGVDEQLAYIERLAEQYDIMYIEDPFDEEDFDSFAKFNQELEGRRLVVGDDLIVTNPDKLKTAIGKHSVNGVIIKPNQIGTLTDMRSTVEIARENNVVPVASHRSGETVDAALAHIAVGLSCPILKIGISGGERLEKFNELMKIEKKIKPPMAKLPGS